MVLYVDCVSYTPENFKSCFNFFFISLKVFDYTYFLVADDLYILIYAIFDGQVCYGD
jgi:hypothetical protein